MSDLSFEHFEVLTDEADAPVVLGSGGMGVTYRAWDTHLAREVALKVIRPSWLEEPLAKERFIREARALAQIHHPNVVGIVHLGETEEGCYYTMEFIRGANLEDRVREKGALDVGWTLFIGRQMAAALNAASKKGIVHRDVKPANIMLVEDEAEGVTAKLIDFGLARNFVPEGGGAEHTGPLTLGGSFVGTPHFASPEQIEEQELDVRSDIYSLGICLFYALTGNIPFNGSTARVMNAQLSEEPDWSGLTAPKRVVALLQRMLKKDPGDRFQSAHELYTEIDALLAEAMRKSNDAELSTIISKSSQQPASGDSRPVQPPRGATGRGKEADSGLKIAFIAAGGGVLLAGIGIGIFFLNRDPEPDPTVAKNEAGTPSLLGEPSSPKTTENPPQLPEDSKKESSNQGSPAPELEPEKTAVPAAEKKVKPPEKATPPEANPTPPAKTTEKPKPEPVAKPEESPKPPATGPKGPAEWEIVAKNARKVRDDLAAEYTDKLEELNAFYLQSLDRLLESETQASRLDSALVIDQEIKRIEGITIATAMESPKATSINQLNRGRQIYQEKAQPIYREFVTKRDAVLEAYEKLLAAQETKLRESNQLAELEKLREAKAEIFPETGKE